MKYAIAIALMLLPVLVVAQKMDSASISRLPPAQQEEVNNYLQKAKASKTGGLVLLIGGGAVAVVGAWTAIIMTLNDDWWDGEEPNYNVAATMMVVGGVAALGGIPLMISARKNRDKARAIVFASPGVSIVPNKLLPHTRQVGLKLVIPLGK
jgi:hypothetical protein